MLCVRCRDVNRPTKGCQVQISLENFGGKPFAHAQVLVFDVQGGPGECSILQTLLTIESGFGRVSYPQFLSL